MVLGTPTTFTPSACSAAATPRVSSPPMATSASTPSPARLSLIRSSPDRPPPAAPADSGFVREEPRIVPPRGRMPLTAFTSSGTVSPSSGPRHPSRNPTNSYPYSGVPVRTSARMTAFSPGQSPPPVSTPTRMGATLVRMSVLAIDAGTTGVTALVVTAEGTVAARGYAEFPQHYPRPGWVEHLPEDIWLAENEAGTWEGLADGSLAAGTVDSYLIARLTSGRQHVTDASNASRTLLFDITTGRWSPELCDLFVVPPHALPEVIPSSGIAGHTDPAAFLGLSLPVAGIAGDQQAALFGQACFAPGDAKCTYGTGSFVLANTGATVARPGNGLLSTVAWMDGTGTLTYALEGSVFVTGAAIQWL